eukprot:6184059-Pleurochrysis_carterae.AAC.1
MKRSIDIITTHHFAPTPAPHDVQAPNQASCTAQLITLCIVTFLVLSPVSMDTLMHKERSAFTVSAARTLRIVRLAWRALLPLRAARLTYLGLLC